MNCISKNDDLWPQLNRLAHGVLLVALIGLSTGGCLQDLHSILLGEEGQDSSTTELLALAALAGAGGGCAPYDWGLPSNVAPPTVPASNCMTAARVDLGRHLFYDKRLSANQTMSCATCHQQALAFTDGVARPDGSTGETHSRNTQHLSNTGYHGRLTWANSLMSNLELQAAVPITAESGPGSIVELGFTDAHLPRFQESSLYAEKFQSAYGVSGSAIKLAHIQRALAAFQRTMLSFDSTYDRFLAGKTTPSAAVIRGAEIFNGETAECFHCHGGFNFADSSFHSAQPTESVAYHNNGLYSADDYAGFTTGQLGLKDTTTLQSDEGRFRAPSLRNLGFTFPYMHDGSITCDGAFAGDRLACARNALGKVITHYETGGKTDSGGDVHPTVDQTVIRPFTLTAGQRSDLVEFLLSLDDASFVGNSSLSNPRTGDANFGP